MKTMKTIMMVLMVCLTSLSFGQDSIRVTKNGITIETLKSKHDDNLTYLKIIEWVNNTYKNV